jgi:hypothetical protein
MESNNAVSVGLPRKAAKKTTRILYLSLTPPVPTWGGAMAFYRHFIERQDFEFKVITNCERFPFQSVPYQPVIFSPSQLTQRLFRTRFLPWIHGVHSLTARGRMSASVWTVAKAFKPDAVFTIAGSWDYSALIAERVAKRLKVPLIASFNDWFNYGWFPPHRTFHAAIERRFRRFYRDADLALCTCEGMREALGPHPRSHILYPIGARLPDNLPAYSPSDGNGRPFIVAFAGSMADWYGPMLERIVSAARAQGAPLEFRFYGSNPRWSREFGALARKEGIFRGHLPFEELRRQVTEADALLLPMGFEERCAQVERTSFKTKFLDYLSYQKPILVWGPDYCSAVRVAREFDSAEICTRPEAPALLEKMLKLRSEGCRQAELVENAHKMYEDRFHPDKIHQGLVDAIQQTVSSFRG